MIRAVDVQDIAECVKVIRDSFSTVANEFGFTIENAPRFTAFASLPVSLKTAEMMNTARWRWCAETMRRCWNNAGNMEQNMS